MAYREPESSIYLLKGCPCDHEYNNTILFETKGAQWNYMKALMVRSFTNQYYQRYNRGVLRIQARTEDLYECNYLVFSNDPRFNIIDVPSDDMKIFYCFIDSIAYINENVTEVHYTIDVMQTYMFDYVLGQCFVEREHTLTDDLFGNLVEENFNPSNYTETVLNNITFNHWCIQIQYVPKDISSDPNAKNIIVSWTLGVGNVITFTDAHAMNGASFRNNTFVGYATVTIPIKGASTIDMTASIQNAIDKLQLLNAQIINVFVLPYELVTEKWAEVEWSNIDLSATHYCIMYKDGYSASYESSVYSISQPVTFYGRNGDYYVPKNKKLYTFPYQSLKISNSEGDTDELMFENFNTTPRLKVIGCECPNPELSIYADAYNGQSINAEHRISLSNIVSCVWSEDSATRYWNENKNKTNLAMLGSALSIIGGIGVSVVTKNPAPAVGSVINAYQHASEISTAKDYFLTSGNTMQDIMDSTRRDPMRNMPAKTTVKPVFNEGQIKMGAAGLSGLIASMLDLENKRDIPQGKVSYSTILYFLSAYGFKIIYKCLKPYDARRLDHYFDMFGYAVKDVKVPNIYATSFSNLRPHWNYIKTDMCVILPKQISTNIKRYVAEDVESAIKSIYNKGITFWKNGEEVGDYSLDNSPVTQI